MPTPRPAARPALWRIGLVAATWVGAVAAVLFVAATTRVGPVVLRLTAGHGVHAGDVFGAAIILVGAGLVTAWILRPQVVSPRVLLVGVVWLLAAVGVLAVATQTAVGPIVLPLGHHRGVRAGDLLAAGALFGAAVLVTVGVALRPRRHLTVDEMSASWPSMPWPELLRRRERP